MGATGLGLHNCDDGECPTIYVVKAGYSVEHGPSSCYLLVNLNIQNKEALAYLHLKTKLP